MYKTRIQNLFLFCVSTVLTGLACTGQKAIGFDGATVTEKPNIVIIFTDDQGYADLGCYGSKKHKTERMDRLAKEGTRYTNFYAQSVCGPSRSALLTGRYPSRSGGWGMSADEITFAELIQEAGYQTACIGKWDVSNRKPIIDRMPNAQGFQYYFGTLGANDGGIVKFHENNTAAGETREMASLTHLYTDKAIDFLENRRDPKKPFLLYLAHTMMHTIIDASPKFRGQSKGDLYGDVVEEFDFETGRLLDKLDALGLSNNTLVIYTSDNGPWCQSKYYESKNGHPKNSIFWGDRGSLRAGKGSAYEAGSRVPCIIRWPGRVAADQTSDAIFSTLDFLPTFAKIAGFKIPTDRIVDGVDQRDLLIGNSKTGARQTFVYSQINDHHVAIRSGKWKLLMPGRKPPMGNHRYLMDFGTDGLELYDLKSDIGETINLAQQHPEIVKQLKLQLESHVKSHQSKQDQTETPSKTPAKNREASEPFYRPNKIQTVHLSITSENQKRMLAALPERIYVPATFRWRNTILTDVAVRFKGNSSSQPSQKHKRSYLIRFDKHSKEQRFLGLQRVSLDNGVQFGSLFSEPIITEILRAEGIPVHRCNYAKLYVNGNYLGVYTNVERIDETFLTSRFGKFSGPLFKVDLGGPGSNLAFIGDEPAKYKQAFEPKSDAAKNHRNQVVDLVRTINKTDDRDFQRQMESALELDDFLKVTAVMLFSGAFDQLTGWNPHNYYLHRDARSGKWRYFAWDLDVGFCETAFSQIKVLDQWHAAWPVPTTSRANPLLDRINSNEALLKKYRRFAKVILERHFQPDLLCARFDEKFELIKNDLAGDPFPHHRATVPGETNYEQVLHSIKDFVRKRYLLANQQLQTPGPKPTRHPSRHGMPFEIQKRVKQIEKGAERMKKNGQDIRPIQEAMQRIGKLMQAQKQKEAIKALDDTLRLIHSSKR